MNKKCVELLKEVIQKNYKNVRQDNMSYDDNEFYYVYAVYWLVQLCFLSCLSLFSPVE